MQRTLDLLRRFRTDHSNRNEIKDPVTEHADTRERGGGVGSREDTGTDRGPPDKHHTGNVVPVWVNGATGDVLSGVEGRLDHWPLEGTRESRGRPIGPRETGRYRVRETLVPG